MKIKGKISWRKKVRFNKWEHNLEKFSLSWFMRSYLPVVMFRFYVTKLFVSNYLLLIATSAGASDAISGYIICNRQED